MSIIFFSFLFAFVTHNKVSIDRAIDLNVYIFKTGKNEKVYYFSFLLKWIVSSTKSCS